MPYQYSEQFKSKYDSLQTVYENNSYEEMLTDFVTLGYISGEMKNYSLSLYNDLKNSNIDVVEYLDNTFDQVSNYNLSPDEKTIFKTELVALKSTYIHIEEINSLDSDSTLVYRGVGDNCDLDWGKVVDYALKGARIGLIITGGPAGLVIMFTKGKDGGSYFSKLGYIASLGGIQFGFYGFLYGHYKASEYKEFCEDCIPTGLSKRTSDNCDHSAYFLPSAGSHAYEFTWNNINGTPETATTVPGQELFITQTVPGKMLLIKVTSHCHLDEDTDMEVKKEFGPYDLYEDQLEVPDGALFFTGEDYFKFPKPSSSDYNNYYHTKTVIYLLSGVAIQYPNIYTISVVSSQNAINVSLSGNELTVTWKVDSQHWGEFYNYGNFGSTIGKVNLNVENNCSGGENKIFTLESIIAQGSFHP